MSKFTYEIKTECDEMTVVVSEPKIRLAVAAARENGLRGQYVETRLVQREEQEEQT